METKDKQDLLRAIRSMKRRPSTFQTDIDAYLSNIKELKKEIEQKDKKILELEKSGENKSKELRRMHGLRGGLMLKRYIWIQDKLRSFKKLIVKTYGV